MSSATALLSWLAALSVGMALLFILLRTHSFVAGRAKAPREIIYKLTYCARKEGGREHCLTGFIVPRALINEPAHTSFCQIAGRAVAVFFPFSVGRRSI